MTAAINHFNIPLESPIPSANPNKGPVRTKAEASSFVQKIQAQAANARAFFNQLKSGTITLAQADESLANLRASIDCFDEDLQLMIQAATNSRRSRNRVYGVLESAGPSLDELREIFNQLKKIRDLSTVSSPAKREPKESTKVQTLKCALAFALFAALAWSGTSLSRYKHDCHTQCSTWNESLDQLDAMGEAQMAVHSSILDPTQWHQESEEMLKEVYKGRESQAFSALFPLSYIPRGFGTDDSSAIGRTTFSAYHSLGLRHVSKTLEQHNPCPSSCERVFKKKN